MKDRLYRAATRHLLQVWGGGGLEALGKAVDTLVRVGQLILRGVALKAIGPVTVARVVTSIARLARLGTTAVVVPVGREGRVRSGRGGGRLIGLHAFHLFPLLQLLLTQFGSVRGLALALNKLDAEADAFDTPAAWHTKT